MAAMCDCTLCALLKLFDASPARADGFMRISDNSMRVSDHVSAYSAGEDMGGSVTLTGVRNTDAFLQGARLSAPRGLSDIWDSCPSNSPNPVKKSCHDSGVHGHPPHDHSQA